MTNAVQISTKADPLDGLAHLRKVAKRGREIVETREEDVAWFWVGCVAEENHCEIAGPSYSGKTTLAMMLAIAAANPGTSPVKILGADVRPNPPGSFSVVVEEENGERSSADVLAACCGMLGLPVDETLARVILVARGDVIAHKVTKDTLGTSVWSDILELGDRGKVGCLILDSRARVLCGGREGSMAGDSDSGDEQAFAQRVIHQAITACGCPVFVVSHTRKTSAGAPLTIEDIAGSHQRGAGADVILLVSAERSRGKVQRSRVVFAKIRDSVEDHPEPQSFAITKAGGKWTLDGAAAGSAREPHERVLETIAASEVPLTSNQIREALGLSGDVVSESIGALLTTRKIAKGHVVIKGRKRDAFSARPDESQFLEEVSRAVSKGRAQKKGGQG